METDQPPKEIILACALFDLALLKAGLNRGFVNYAVEVLKAGGYSMRQISRETGIPRTTLTRWAAAE